MSFKCELISVLFILTWKLVTVIFLYLSRSCSNQISPNDITRIQHGTLKIIMKQGIIVNYTGKCIGMSFHRLFTEYKTTCTNVT